MYRWGREIGVRFTEGGTGGFLPTEDMSLKSFEGRRLAQT